MKIFIDSAKLWEIEKVYCCGVLDGVTTNPTLIHQAVEELKEKGETQDMAKYIKRILQTAHGTPVSLEVTEYAYEKMVDQGMALYQMFNPVAGNIYIKVPVNPSFEGEKGRDFEGIKAIKTLTDAGIPVNATLIFTPEQALMAAKAGSRFVSPYVGRLDDYIMASHGLSTTEKGHFPDDGFKSRSGLLDDNGIVSGIDLIKKTVEIFRIFDVKSEVLAASIRTSRQAREAALAGADIATLPLDVILDLLKHPKTREGMELFKEDTVKEYAGLTKKK